MGSPCFNASPDDNMTSRGGGGAGGGGGGGQDDEATPAEELIKFIIVDIAVPFVCCLGLLGNLLSLVVLATERIHRTLTKMEISAHIGLIALAVSDFLFCLMVLIFTQVNLKKYYEEGDMMIYIHLMGNGLITLFIIASTWLIVVMAAERYIAVCHPLRARKVISLRRTRIVTFFVFLLCSLATVPIFLEGTIAEVVCADGQVFYELERRSEQSLIVRRILWAVFFDFIPCIALIYFNACLIVQIRKAKKLRESMTQQRHHSTNNSRTQKQQLHQLQHHHQQQGASRRDPDSMKYKRKNTADNGVILVEEGERQSNQLCLQSLLMPESSTTCVIDKESEASCLKTHYHKTEETTTLHGCLSMDPRHTAATNLINGHHGAAPGDILKSKNSPRKAWHGDRSRSSISASPGFPASVRTKNSQFYDQQAPMSTSAARGSLVVTSRRTIKTSTVKKRPSDGALNSVTATLVAVVILFLVLVSPCEIIKFSLTYTSAGCHRVVTYITNFMQVTNFSLNFVLYCAVNKSFRYTLKRIAVTCCYSIRKRS